MQEEERGKKGGKHQEGGKGEGILSSCSGKSLSNWCSPCSPIELESVCQGQPPSPRLQLDELPLCAQTVGCAAVLGCTAPAESPLPALQLHPCFFASHTKPQGLSCRSVFTLRMLVRPLAVGQRSPSFLVSLCLETKKSLST